MNVDIGLNRVGLAKLRDDLTAALEKADLSRVHGGDVEVTLHHPNGTVTISNDDMEREDVADDEVYVDVSR